MGSPDESRQRALKRTGKQPFRLVLGEPRCTPHPAVLPPLNKPGLASDQHPGSDQGSLSLYNILVDLGYYA
jgi:hypothetical protein